MLTFSLSLSFWNLDSSM